MKLSESLVSVDYPDGNRIAVRIPDLTAADRAILARYDDQLAAIIDEVGGGAFLVALVEEIHEDAIYRKVAERRGVLAL